MGENRSFTQSICSGFSGGGGGGRRGGLDVQDVEHIFGEKSTLDRRALLVLITFVHLHVAVTAIVAVTVIACVVVSVRHTKVGHLQMVIIMLGVPPACAH